MIKCRESQIYFVYGNKIKKKNQEETKHNIWVPVLMQAFSHGPYNVHLISTTYNYITSVRPGILFPIVGHLLAYNCTV